MAPLGETFEEWARALLDAGDPLALRALRDDRQADWRALAARYAGRAQ